MKLSVPFFGSSSAKQDKVATTTKQSARPASKDGGKLKSGSFGSTTSSEDSASAVTTPRTVLPAPGKRTKLPAVTRGDLEVALRRVVASEAELAAVLAEADAAGLALEEVAAAEAEDEAELRDAFAVFDADGDGRISAEELRAVLAELGDDACSVDDCRRMIRGVDADGDGFVCFHEFSRMMMHGP